ncbi:MAG: nucleotide sugar dehydrogenase [Pirellula sp.]|nr:nucleotide sugar dehydrogenase [Pirellula sp.]
MKTIFQVQPTNRENRPRLSVVGLGKLGSPMVAVFADKGFQVTGLDINPQFVAALNEGRAPVEEPGLQELLDKNRERISATTDFADLVRHTDVTFVIVPTPSGSDACFTNKFVVDAVTKIGVALRAKKEYHLVVVTSTVMPGSTDGEIRDALEAASGRQVGEELGLCYNPEFIALGSVIRDMLYPDMILIGESDKKAGDILETIYTASTLSKPEIHRMNCVNAELTKISVNTYVTTKISYANMISEMCDHLPNADANVVSSAIGADSRIGKKYIKSAVGYGGPCFPRDNKAFAALGRRLGVRCDLAEATDRINDHQLVRMSDVVDAHLPENGCVAILGLSYKPMTPVVEASQGLMLAELLADAGRKVVAFDPIAAENAKSKLGSKVTFASTTQEAIDQADVVVVMTPSPEYASLKPESFSTHGRVRVGVKASLSTYIVPGRSRLERDTVTQRQVRAA